MTSSPDTLPWSVVAIILAAAVLVRRRKPWLRLAVSAAGVATFATVLLPVVGSLLQPAFAPAAAGPLAQKVLVALWWLLLARTAVLAVRVALRIHHRQHAARLASDLAAGAVYLATGIIVVDLAFGVSVTGLVATSGIIAIVVGLALQSTLADLFSGIALGIDKPFAVGDAVWIEGEIAGRVIETTWRSTRVLTAGSDVATVPNSVVAKARLLNRSSPDETRTETVRVVLDPAVLPADGVALIAAAAMNAESLARDGRPDVACVDLSSHGTTYEIGFAAAVSDVGRRRTELLHQVARHARYAGVAIGNREALPFPPALRPGTLALLGENAVLRHLAPEERAALAARVIRRRGEAGEVLVTQGGRNASLFIVVTGVLEGSREEGHGPSRLGLIGPGSCFGHLSLVTDDGNPASVSSLTPYEVIEVERPALGRSLTDNVPLVEALRKTSAHARVVLHLDVPSPPPIQPATRRPLRERLRALLDAEG